MSSIIPYLKDLGLETWTEGENVRRGWVNIQCPFCDDAFNHCGINLFNLDVKCWRCGEHQLYQLLQKVDPSLGREAYENAKQFKQELRSLGEGGSAVRTPMKNRKASSAMTSVRFPPELSTHFPKMHMEYLKSRGFPRPRKLVRQYRLAACYTIGRYKFRIIIPIVINREVVSFTSKDITGDQHPPYLNASIEESIINPAHCIYNYDTIIQGGDAILVEGPIDVWKLGEGAISILGVEHHEQQIIYLMKKEINKLFILFDNDPPGRRTARRLGRIMAPIVKEVELIFLRDKNDPGELTLSEGELLKERIGFNK